MRGGHPHYICHHFLWIFLGHPLLNIEELTHLIARPDHHCGSVALAVKFKLRTTRSLVAHLPQHGGAVIIIKHIACVNEEEPPVLLLGVLLPQEPHRVNTPLDPGFQILAELLRLSDILDLCPCHCYHTLCEQSHPGLYHPEWL